MKKQALNISLSIQNLWTSFHVSFPDLRKLLYLHLTEICGKKIIHLCEEHRSEHHTMVGIPTRKFIINIYVFRGWFE